MHPAMGAALEQCLEEAARQPAPRHLGLAFPIRAPGSEHTLMPARLLRPSQALPAWPLPVPQRVLARTHKPQRVRHALLRVPGPG